MLPMYKVRGKRSKHTKKPILLTHSIVVKEIGYSDIHVLVSHLELHCFR